MHGSIEFIFVRHGQSMANANRVMNRHDSPLTELGVSQAREAASAIRDLGITMIAHSPLRRAEQTAEVIGTEFGLDGSRIRPVEDLRERGFGKLEGQPLDRTPLLYYTENDDVMNFEPRSILYERMKACLGTLKQIALEQKLLVVGHTISGFYLSQIAADKPSVEAFDVPPRMRNANFMKISMARGWPHA